MKNLIGCVVGVFTILLCFSACDLLDNLEDELKNTREETLFILNGGIATIEDESESWQSVLENMQDQLTEDVQSTVRNEVMNLMQTGIAMTGAELRCNADFLKNRAIKGLKAIRDRFLGNEVPIVEPIICQVIPTVINLNENPEDRNLIEFWGYDMEERSLITAFLENNEGTRYDISIYVQVQTDYHFTINLANYNAVFLNTFSFVSILFEDKEISAIPIQPIEVFVPDIQDVSGQPLEISYMPPHTNGDREFDGHGPNVTVVANIGYDAVGVYLRVYMKAIETKSDWTTAEGTSPKNYFYTPPFGYHIKQVNGQKDWVVMYTDNDHSDDIHTTSLGQFIIVGDTGGDDAGVDTQVTIRPNAAFDVPIVIEENN
mgnify:CR=1 FL=1|jgi:hypothetical protein